MYKKIIIVLSILFTFHRIASVSYANKQELSLSTTSSVDWLALSDSMQKRIVRDYVNALDSFAQAMPIVGGDTESMWAADTVHTMAQRVKEGQQSKNHGDGSPDSRKQ